ncbi:type VII secretion protein EccE [Nocardia sp. NEAU-G5]|uniref:Type VII secretion protein EccE n=1 Tax=Nocardia albiluteola TaxID=2842303 RepID=A0ABS6B990_9NOCA|nr:type VII secretion protein EccE [Nocardia albiluteola]MBU3066834.1 type VII secretion protein EccE [Nocardia albiluteola]
MSLVRVRIGGVERGPFAVVAVGGSLAVTGLIGRTPWWVSAVVVTTLLFSVAVQVGARTPARAMIDWSTYRFGLAARARLRANLPPAWDVEVSAGVCGVSGNEVTLLSMIQLAPDLDLPTIISDKLIYTEDTVSVAGLLPMLDQFGIAVDIDIVTTGQRLRPTGSYSMLYDQLIGSQPVVGHRLTWLVVRLDQERNLPALSRRGPCETVAPKALAIATHRIAQRLREQGLSAHALPADALVEATLLLHAGVEPAELRETWRHLQSSVPGRCVTSYLVDWTRMNGASLDDCWTWNRGHTTVVVSLSADTVGPRALVRYVGPPTRRAPAGYLRSLGGLQSTALLASLPTATSIRALPQADSGIDTAPEEVLEELAVAIGPNGQILGAISGQPRHTLALPLYDPARYNPQRRTIDVHAVLPVAQQIVLRAMAVGADVEVHSARPDRWQQLVAAIGDTHSLRLATSATDTEDSVGEDDSASVTIAVFDQVPPRASAAHTTVTISDPGAPHRRNADLTIEQVGHATVDVSIPMRTVRVDLIEPHGETRYLQPPGYVAAPPASAVPVSAAPAFASGSGPVSVPDTRHIT